jgi:GNAT superfamily N-acetyltransferase
VILRPAHPHEADDLTALTRRSKAHWGYDQDFLAGVDHLLVVHAAHIREGGHVVAEDEGVLLGYYRLGGSPPDGELMDLFVDPKAIGTGLGRTLWEHAVAGALARGFRRLNLEADPHAEPFYLRMGAVRVGEREVAPGRLLPLMSFTPP